MKDALAKIIVEKAQVYGGQVSNAVDVAQAVMEYKPDGKVTVEEIIHAWEMCCEDVEEEVGRDKANLCELCHNSDCDDDTRNDAGRVVRCSEFTGRNE